MKVRSLHFLFRMRSIRIFTKFSDNPCYELLGWFTLTPIKSHTNNNIFLIHAVKFACLPLVSSPVFAFLVSLEGSCLESVLKSVFHIHNTLLY